MTSELTWPSIIDALLTGRDLSISEATWSMEQVMTGDVTPAQLGAFLVALRAKGETVDEIVGFRDAVLAHAVPLPVDSMAVDIVGTGGDRFGTVNVSTMASVVVAATGVPVIKHDYYYNKSSLKNYKFIYCNCSYGKIRPIVFASLVAGRYGRSNTSFGIIT